MHQLLLGTLNPGKQEELRALLAGPLWELVIPQDLDLELEIEETGDSYEENARLKASAFAERSGLWSLSDDSGLEVDALGGAPGLHSARLAGKGSSDADRRQVLLGLLSPHPRPWTGRFRSTVALAGPAGELDLAEGECSGEIIPEERGSGGFGYDPLFLIDGSGKTMAELEMAEKNLLSHRARAIEAIRSALEHRLSRK